jgi:hypothetical protein
MVGGPDFCAAAFASPWAKTMPHTNAGATRERIFFIYSSYKKLSKIIFGWFSKNQVLL